MQLTNYLIFFSLPMIIDVFVKENNNNDNLSRWQLSTSSDKTRRVHVQGRYESWEFLQTNKDTEAVKRSKQSLHSIVCLFVYLS